MNNIKKTIAVICDKNPRTSFGQMSLNLRRALRDEFDAHIVWLVTPKYFPDGLPLCDNDYDHVIRAPSLEIGWLLFRKPLRQLLKKIKPDITLLIRPELGFLIREIHKMSSPIRVVMFVHDMFAETLYDTSVKFKLINKFFIAPTREADGFLYNSEYTRNEAHRVMGLDKNGAVVGCPIDRSVFKPRGGNKSSLKEKWKLDKYKGVCLNISLDEPRKNIVTYFNLAKARPDTAFVRVGPFSSWMKKWIDDNRVTNIIHYSGISREDLLELYGSTDLLVFPSYLEGFGVPPFEALACGIQAVAANTSALKENLTGIIPLVDPPDNIDEYLKVIDDVISGKNIVDRPAAEKLLAWSSIESFGERVRVALWGMI